MELLREFMVHGNAVLGVCRGAGLNNIVLYCPQWLSVSAQKQGRLTMHTLKGT